MSSSEDFQSDLELREADSRFKTKQPSLEQEHSEDESGSEEESFDEATRENASALQPLSQEQLLKFQAKIEKTGVCYMSRIPPFMKHTKLRSLLAKYGELGRIYLNPEDSKSAAKRKKYKRNKRVNFVEGWIEFLDKKTARQVAEKLNNTNIGGKKRSYYYDDIWNIKYLPKFKWNHLTEQLAYELKVKEQKLKNEMSQAKRENKMYLKNVERAKMIEAMEAKKKNKRSADQDESAVPANQDIRKFKQRKVVGSSKPIIQDLFK
ncbi:Activator of basal transcription 1 [Kappamyces sp. JEL0680]|nr:Activator of basal transcription 1 [Kappamyces sp. JEL0680]